MGTVYDDVDVVCPFYQSEKKMAIRCEGVSDAMVNISEYRTMADKKSHKEMFCKGKYKTCDVYEMIMKKYTD